MYDSSDARRGAGNITMVRIWFCLHRGGGMLDLRHCAPSPKPSFTFGSLKSLMAVTSLFIDMAGAIPFHMGEDLELGICGRYRKVLS